MRSLMVLMILLSLVSCQKPLTVLVTVGEPSLLALVRAEVSRQPNGTQIRVTDDPAQAVSSENLVVIATQLGWNLPPGVPAPGALPADWDQAKAYVPVAALASVSQNADGTWASLPLFFDAFGQTTFREENDKSPIPPASWPELVTQGAPTSVFVDGSRPSFRQTAVFLTTGETVPSLGADAWFGQSVGPWQQPLATLGPLVRQRTWASQAWQLARPDVLADYHPGTNHRFIETFRDFSQTNPTGFRAFVPITATHGGGYAMAGQVVFLQFRGAADQLSGDLPVIRALTAPDFQKAVGSQTKWLAVNLQAAEIDGTGATVRRMANGAGRFYPVTDDLPKPMVENNLFVGIQLAIGRTPRQ